MFTGMRVTVAISALALILALVIGLLLLGFGNTDRSIAGIQATAVLASPSGESIGSVSFTQSETGVLVEADAGQLEPGGHAVAIHAVGSCSPDFSAAGDRFDPSDKPRAFVHANWNRADSDAGAHGGDLPNLYAASDGSARADFFTNGITLESGRDHSVFDLDGSAIVVYEFPDSYDAEHADTGERVACGVIQQQQ